MKEREPDPQGNLEPMPTYNHLKFWHIKSPFSVLFCYQMCCTLIVGMEPGNGHLWPLSKQPVVRIPADSSKPGLLMSIQRMIKLQEGWLQASFWKRGLRNSHSSKATFGCQRCWVILHSPPVVSKIPCQFSHCCAALYLDYDKFQWLYSYTRQMVKLLWGSNWIKQTPFSIPG